MPVIPRVDRIKNIYSSAKALNFGFRLSATNPQAVLFDGVSCHFPQLQRVTIRFCRTRFFIFLIFKDSWNMYEKVIFELIVLMQVII